MTKLERLAQEHKPKLIVAGFSAYSRKLDFARFRQIADSVGALSDGRHRACGGSGRGGTLSQPDTTLPCRDHHDAQDAARPARRADPLAPPSWRAKIDKAVFPGTQGGPLMHIIAAKAVAFKEALAPAFKAYQQQVVDNAQTLATSLQEHGLRLVSGGTDNHLMLVDVRPLHVNGSEAEDALEAVHITVNKNGIPFDPRAARAHQRRPAGHASGHDARLRRERNARGGRSHH